MTEYAVPQEMGSPYTFMDSSDSSALIRDIVTVRISSRRFVVAWAEDGPNTLYSDHPYVAAISGYVNESLSITWGTAVVLYEQETVGAVGFSLSGVATSNAGFFILINEFLTSGSGNIYALHGIAGLVGPGGSIAAGGLQTIEGPFTDTADRILSASVSAFTTTDVGLVYTQGIAPITDCKTRRITVSGNTFGFSGAATHAIGTDIAGISMLVLSSTHGVLSYLEGSTFTKRVLQRSGDFFNFGSSFTMTGQIGKVSPTTFANLSSNQIRICEIDTGSLTLQTTGAFVNWHTVSVTARATLYLLDDQLFVIGTLSGALYANGVSASGTTAIVPNGIAVNLGAYVEVGGFAVLGNGIIVSSFDDEIVSPEYSEYGATYAIAYTGAMTPSTTAYLLGVSVGNNLVYVTAWADSLLVLNVINLALGEQTDSIILGEASFTQVQTKTRIAYPCAVSDTHIFIYGRIETLIGLTHVMYSDDGGDNFAHIESSWQQDYAGSMVCLGENEFYVMRCNSFSSKLYHGTLTGTEIRSTLPFAGPVEPHGVRMSPWDGSIVAAVKKANEPQTVIYSVPPYLAWQDITLNHPQTAVNAVAPL